MKQLINHKIDWLTKVLFVLIGILVFRSNVIAGAATPIIFEQGHHIGILETYTYNEVESSAWGESGRSSKVNLVILKSEAGLESESMPLVTGIAVKTGSQLSTRFV
jgi:hypothetical protein